MTALLGTYLTGVAGVVGVALAWVGIQHAWRRMFPDRLIDPDALAGRMGCLGCARHDPCPHRTARGACAREEVPS